MRSLLFVVRTRESAGVDFGTTSSLCGQCLLLGGLAFRNDEVHVCVDGETDDFLVERLGEAAGLKIEAEQSLAM